MAKISVMTASFDTDADGNGDIIELQVLEKYDPSSRFWPAYGTPSVVDKCVGWGKRVVR